MTQIMSHGKWVPYQPDTLPEHAPFNALFARREGDGVDWYDYSRDAKNFGTDTVKFTVMWQDVFNGWVVGAAVRDATMLHPANQQVLEVIDYHGSDPQADLGGKLFNLDTMTLHGLPKLPPAFDFSAVLDRLAVIEAKLGISP